MSVGLEKESCVAGEGASIVFSKCLSSSEKQNEKINLATYKMSEEYKKQRLFEKGRDICRNRPFEQIKPNDDDYNTLLQIFQHRYNFEPAYFFIDNHSTYQSNYFPTFPLKSDPSKRIPISIYKYLFQTRQQEEEINKRKAFRQSVKGDIDEFRELLKGQELMCEKCNTSIIGYYEVDHLIPFIDLVNNFLKEEKLTLNEVEIEWVDLLPYIRDYTLKRKWKKYHKQNAKLRPLHRECNRVVMEGATSSQPKRLLVRS